MKKENDGLDKSLAIACLALSLFVFLFSLVFSNHNFLTDALLSFGASLKGKSQLNAGKWMALFREGYFAAAAFFAGSAVFFCKGRASLSQKQKNLVAALAFAAYLAITFLTVVLHEPWGDEVHAWFMAKEYSVGRLLYEMRYEGHFILWYLLLMPFAKLGFPVIALNMLSWTLMAFSAAVFVKKSPFGLSAKILALFTNAALFWYPVVSRCYALVPALLFLLAALRQERGRHCLLYGLLIALLANTHAYIEGLVGMLSLDFFIFDLLLPWKTLSKKQRAARCACVLVILAGVLFAFLQVAPALFIKDKNPAASVGFDAKEFFSFLKGSEIFPLLWPFFIAALALALFSLFKSDKVQFANLSVSLLFMGLFSAVLYGARIPNRALLWFFAVIFFFWISNVPDNIKSAALIALSLFILRPSLALKDWRQNFSMEKPIARFIEKNYAPDVQILTEMEILSPLISKDYKVCDINTRKLLAPLSLSYDSIKQKQALDSSQDRFAGIDKFPTLIICYDELPDGALSGYIYATKVFPSFYCHSGFLYELSGKKED